MTISTKPNKNVAEQQELKKYVTGLIVFFDAGRFFNVCAFNNGEKIFIGLVSKKSLFLLLQKQIPTISVRKFSTMAPQEPLELKP